MMSTSLGPRPASMSRGHWWADSISQTQGLCLAAALPRPGAGCHGTEAFHPFIQGLAPLMATTKLAACTRIPRSKIFTYRSGAVHRALYQERAEVPGK